MTTASLNDAERAFAAAAVRRKTLFRTLAIVGVVVAAALAVFYGLARAEDPSAPLASHFVVVVLVLLNARQNLRQHKYAVLLEKLMRAE